ncbi:MAG TPA: hypothetical protein VJ656_11230 [Pyrinomonadaceae bacterium]|nr:hypothetical protein [Pyrinomonadaceae bacterium]
MTNDFSNFYLHQPILHSHLVGLNPVLHRQAFPGSHIKLPAVPPTLDDVPA